jgi:hypothetical protein
VSATFNDPEPSGVAGPKPPPTVMRGPEHADNYRIKVGRYKERWYRDPLPATAVPARDAALTDEAYPSVSTIKGASGKDWTYVSLMRVAHADDLPEISTKGYFERYERLKVINSLDLSAAMRRGTNVHTYAECLAYGISPWSLLNTASDGADYFPCVERLFAELQPELFAAEVVAIHRSMHGVGYGGTSDGIFRIFGGLYMVDWKSRRADGDHDCYPEEAGQLGGYTGAEYMIVADDDPNNPHGAKRVDVPQLDGGLIISIKPDSYEVYPVDLTKAQDHFEAMHLWWLARTQESKQVGPKWPPRRAAANLEPMPEALADAVDAYVPGEHDYAPQFDEERRDALYARFDKLTKAQQEQFTNRLPNIDRNDLDAVEKLIDDIVDPPKIIDMAQARTARDRERDADRRLAAEGGPAFPSDIKTFELRWEMGMTKPGQKWLGRVVNEALDGGADFRLSELRSQRRADIYCALTEWATVDEFDWNHDEPFRAAIATVCNHTDAMPDAVGVLVGSLSTEEAAALRRLVTEIGAGRMRYLVSPDAAPVWVPRNPSESEQAP